MFRVTKKKRDPAAEKSLERAKARDSKVRQLERSLTRHHRRNGFGDSLAMIYEGN